MRLDKYLAEHVANLSRAQLQLLIKGGTITINGEPTKASHTVMPGEVIQINIPPKPPSELIAQDLPLQIVYEDEYLVVVNKPAGMVVHPAYGHRTGTLANALLHHFQNVSLLDEARPGIVHRLDKDTSGLLVVARDERTHAALAEQFKAKTTQREYLAVVCGIPKPKRDTISSFLTRSTKDRRKIVVNQTEGKWAVTHYEVAEKFHLHALLRVRLETGRMHQIRVHLAHRGYPVFGDPTYEGRKGQLQGLNIADTRFVVELLENFQRQALHAHTLGFVHPATGETLSFKSELPADMEGLLLSLRQAHSH
ncbi:MAG: RluA family pseudouridine synthase [candidate division KSB1 bacterium]